MGLLEALTPLLRHLQFLGLNPLVLNNEFQLKTSAFLLGYSGVSLVLFTALFVYGFFDRASYSLTSDANSDVAHTVDFVQLIGIRSAHIVILIEAVLRRGDFMKLLRKLDDWDKQLGQPSIDHKGIERRITIKLIGATLFYIGIQLVILATVLLRQQYAFIYYWTSYLIPFLVCSFRYFQLYVIAWLINDRYQLINAKLQVTSFNSPYEISFSSMREVSTKNSLKVYEELNNIRSLYDKLWELMGLANKCFGVSLLLDIGNDFIAITGQCYWIFLTITNLPISNEDLLAVAASIIWIVPSFVNIIMICAICHKTSNSANDTGSIVHKINYDASDHTQVLYIEQFSLQLLHQRAHFTAFGFFNVDFSLLFTMVGATTTYLVILIQFHLTEL